MTKLYAYMIPFEEILLVLGCTTIRIVCSMTDLFAFTLQNVPARSPTATTQQIPD